MHQTFNDPCKFKTTLCDVGSVLALQSETTCVVQSKLTTTYNTRSVKRVLGGLVRTTHPRFRAEVVQRDAHCINISWCRTRQSCAARLSVQLGVQVPECHTTGPFKYSPRLYAEYGCAKGLK